MKHAARVALVSTCLTFAAIRTTLAQIPGESSFESKRSFREEFRAAAYEEVRTALDEWAEQINNRKADKLRKGVATPVLFAPVGLSGIGDSEFGDSVATWLQRVAGYHVSIADFDASGNIAYVYGTTRYHLSTGSGGSDVNAEVIIVLYRTGSRWKIRSYLERPLTP